ncbi:hypothetical protein GCM10022197_21960 [Microlunatus spumicola]|uniref:Uncharacterized protein n=1 Tax=Microlunatus spumicola TaxID=81499 RepID=A0ABP6XEH2_9ACTN
MTHGLSARIRSNHVRSRIRGPYLAPESINVASVDDFDGVGAGYVRPPSTPRPAAARRDGLVRIGALVPMDSTHRVSLAKPLAALGWDTGTDLVVAIEGRQGVVRPGKPTRDNPWLIPARVAGGRLTVPPPLTGALALSAGDQVLAIAFPAFDELRLLSAADALQELTGTLTVDDVVPTVTVAPARVGVSTRIRPAYGHSA